jgi:hypothetical protein
MRKSIEEEEDALVDEYSQVLRGTVKVPTDDPMKLMSTDMVLRRLIRRARKLEYCRMRHQLRTVQRHYRNTSASMHALLGNYFDAVKAAHGERNR